MFHGHIDVEDLELLSRTWLHFVFGFFPSESHFCNRSFSVGQGLDWADFTQVRRLGRSVFQVKPGQALRTYAAKVPASTRSLTPLEDQICGLRGRRGMRETDAMRP